MLTLCRLALWRGFPPGQIDAFSTAVERFGPPVTLVSVAMPAYNDERYVDEAIKSVQAQTHRDLELLVIDDGSSDRTAETAQAAADDDGRVKVVSFQNGGPAVARNRALAAASGAYFATLDADDLWRPTKLERQLAVLEAQPASVVVGSLMLDVRADGTQVPLPRFLRPTLGVDTAEPSCQERIRRAKVLPFPLSSAMFRTDVIRRIGGCDETLPGGFAEDIDLLARVAAEGHVSMVMDVLGKRRISESSMVNRNMLDAARSYHFVLERVEARARGDDLTWQQFVVANPITLRDLRESFALSCHQRARLRISDGRIVSAGAYVAAEMLAWPEFMPHLIHGTLQRWRKSGRVDEDQR